MTEEEKATLLQRAKQYNAEAILNEAAKLLSINKKIKVEIDDCEWGFSKVTDVLIFKIWYSVNGNNVVINLIEGVFKDFDRKSDKDIGIKPGMSLRQKVILRLAYVLYKHRED